MKYSAIRFCDANLLFVARNYFISISAGQPSFSVTVHIAPQDQNYFPVIPPAASFSSFVWACIFFIVAVCMFCKSMINVGKNSEIVLIEQTKCFNTFTSDL